MKKISTLMYFFLIAQTQSSFNDECFVLLLSKIEEWLPNTIKELAKSKNNIIIIAERQSYDVFTEENFINLTNCLYNLNELNKNKLILTNTEIKEINKAYTYWRRKIFDNFPINIWEYTTLDTIKLLTQNCNKEETTKEHLNKIKKFIKNPTKNIKNIENKESGLIFNENQILSTLKSLVKTEALFITNQFENGYYYPTFFIRFFLLSCALQKKKQLEIIATEAPKFWCIINIIIKSVLKIIEEENSILKKNELTKALKQKFLQSNSNEEESKNLHQSDTDIQKIMFNYFLTLDKKSFENFLKKIQNDIISTNMKEFIYNMKYISLEFLQNIEKYFPRYIEITSNKIEAKFYPPNLFSFIIDGNHNFWNQEFEPLSIALTPFYSKGKSDFQILVSSSSQKEIQNNVLIEVIFDLIGITFYDKELAKIKAEKQAKSVAQATEQMKTLIKERQIQTEALRKKREKEAKIKAFLGPQTSTISELLQSLPSSLTLSSNIEQNSTNTTQRKRERSDSEDEMPPPSKIILKEITN